MSNYKRDANGWIGAETPPLRCGRYLVKYELGVSVAAWSSRGWATKPGSWGIKTTHWQPLPGPPVADEMEANMISQHDIRTLRMRLKTLQMTMRGTAAEHYYLREAMEAAKRIEQDAMKVVADSQPQAGFPETEGDQ